MSDRIIDLAESGAYLRVQNRQLVIERDGEEPVSTPLSEVAAVIATHPQVQCSVPMLAELMQAGGALVVCDRRHLPVGMMLPLTGHSVQTERFAAQAAAALPVKKRLWKQIITRKILAQADLLTQLRGDDHGLSAIARSVRSGDPSNREAVASRRYWPALFADIPPLAGRLQPHGRGGAAGGAVAVALLLACSVATVAAARSVPVRRVAAERAERIKAAVGPEDLVVSVAMYRWFMEYEWQRQGFEAEVFSFPPEHDRQLCWDDPERELADAAGLARGVSQVVSRVREALAESRSVWLLAHGEPSGPRWEVDGKLFAGLAAAGIEVRPYDEAVGLARLGHATKGERKGAREQGSKGAREQGSEGARERGSEGARDQGSREMEGRSGNLKLGAGDGARVVDDDLRSQISMRVSGTCARVQ
ncbi:MAG TPA: type II CRISPR-associated endonuclease Cas1 [Opitutaceae bacterium]